jgi:hypothetical protein
MALNLSITDNQAVPTGATCTITGGDAGTTNTVYTLTVAWLQSGIGGAPYWTSRGTRVGNGTLAIALPAGYFWAYAAGTVGGSPAVTPPVYFLCSPNIDSVYQRCRLAVQARIQALSLPGNPPLPALTSERVYLQAMLMEHKVQYPCIVISEEDEQEQLRPATNLRDDIEYPVRVFILDRQSRQFDRNLPTYLLWRERIMSSFRYQRLANVPEIWNCSIQPQLVIDEAVQQKYQHVVSGMVLRFLSREGRAP